MRQRFGGKSRSVIHKKHALITPDSHEITPMPNWRGAQCVVVIAPQMGAKFCQFFVNMPQACVASAPSAGSERFFMVLDGKVSLHTKSERHDMDIEHYALVPTGMEHEISASADSRLLVIERHYEPLAGEGRPPLVVAATATQPATRVDADGELTVTHLIPADLRFDCAVNIMDFAPGTALPYVETHFVEHGLLMLDGGGVYRLDDDWYIVEGGDVIWMGPFCAQWFGALGTRNARYLIYKDWNREPLAG